MSCPQGSRAGGCLPTEAVPWSQQHRSASGSLGSLGCPGRPGCSERGAAETCGALGEMEMLPAPPHLGFGSSSAIPTMSPCQTAQPGPAPWSLSKGSLIAMGQGPGGAWADAPHKGTFGAFLCSGGSARTSDGPGVGLNPFARSELRLFPLSPSASSSALCHRAWQRCDKPRPPPALQRVPVPLPALSPVPWQLPLCGEQSRSPSEHKSIAGSAAITEGTSWSVRYPLPTVLGREGEVGAEHHQLMTCTVGRGTRADAGAGGDAPALAAWKYRLVPLALLVEHCSSPQ